MQAEAVALVNAAELAGSHGGDMSIWGLFLQADLIIKTIMLALVAASVWSWAIILDKWMTIRTLSNRAGKFERLFWSGESLDNLYTGLKKKAHDPMSRIFCAGMYEWKLSLESQKTTGYDDSLRAGMQQRIERAMLTATSREMTVIEKYMTFLGTVGSTAPFIGLFGTVWGIMNSFSAIAGSQNTSLAVVAPGIAEALFATALGLVAAIPAVVAYNKFSTDIGRYGDRLDEFATEFSSILSRHFDMQGGGK